LSGTGIKKGGQNEKAAIILEVIRKIIFAIGCYDRNVRDRH
jgi:hypothetical protein